LSSSPNNLAFTPFNSVKNYIGPVYDELALLSGNNIPNKFPASTGYYRDAGIPALNTWTVSNGATYTSINAWGGSSNAIELTLIGGNSTISAVQPTLGLEVQAWVEFMLGPTTSGPALSNPLKELEVSLGNAAGDSIVFQRNFEIQASTRWRQMRIPIQLRVGISAATYNTWRISGRNVTPTSQNVRIANFRVYESVEPINWDTRCIQKTVAVTPPAIAAGTTWETTVSFANTTITAVQNVALGDFALSSYSVALPSGVVLYSRCAAASVIVGFHNATAGSVTLPAGNLSVKVFKN
jgi:hypothetical protein